MITFINPTKIRLNIFLVSMLMLGTGSTAAHAFQKYAVTPSGNPEAIFNSDQDETRKSLEALCLRLGWFIYTSGGSNFVCEQKVSKEGQLLMGIMVGSGSTGNRWLWGFSVAEIDGKSRVTGRRWMENQGTFGGVNRYPLDGDSDFNELLNFMIRAGGELPPGATFPNHAYLGLQGDQLAKEGVRVDLFEKDSPAELAGVRVGDLITRIAGKRLKSDQDWWEAVARAARSETFEVEILRNGEKIRLSVQRAFRAPIKEPPPPALPQDILEEAIGAKEEPKPQTFIQPLSVADEIAKFAKLRDEGVITEEEFQEQKRKLLQGS